MIWHVMSWHDIPRHRDRSSLSAEYLCHDLVNIQCWDPFSSLESASSKCVSVSQCQTVPGCCFKTSALQTKMAFICFPRRKPGLELWLCYTHLTFFSHCSMSLQYVTAVCHWMLNIYCCTLHLLFSKWNYRCPDTVNGPYNTLWWRQSVDPVKHF